MKLRLAVILFFSSVLIGCVTTPYKPIETSEVISIPAQSQKDIYNKTRQWFSQNSVSGKSVVDYEDPETGTIIGNGIADIGTDMLGIIKYSINYNIRVDTKDGKFRALTTIVKHTNTVSSSTYTVHNVSEKRNKLATEHVKKIVQNIKAYVTNDRHDSNSNW